VNRTVAALPQDDVDGSGWQPATPEYVGQFTGVGYFFARHLQQELNVPIGLLNTSWGGTHVETWTSREAFEGDAEFAAMINRLSATYIDSIQQEKVKAFEALKRTIESKKDDSGAVDEWPTIGYNANGWATLNVPGLWEQQGFEGLDGVVWIRREVEITVDQSTESILHLGMIDDNDVTWVNGVKVGETIGYNKERNYKIPAGLLKKGKNVIAIRIDDTGGGGGLYSPKEEIYLSLANGDRLPLIGQWRVNVEKVVGSASALALGPNEYPTLLYNGMVHPLIPFGIRGALWYQGESNTGRAFQYRKAFPLMINDWRKRWGQGHFPFYFVQLATYFAGAGGNQNSGNEWAELREAQTFTLSLPNTGMAVTTDIGNPKDIHPTNKQEVGHRLALQALQKTYGQQQLISSGPTVLNVVMDGEKAILHFGNTGSGLTTPDKYSYLYGFEVAGSDQQWHFARAWIEGNTVILQSDKVPNPVSVRYNWTDNAEAGNLFNKEGLPAAPFRTDDWKRSTEGRMFME
jgi:sialate O-acetylesterase